jgi:hypothetical protein
VLRLFGEVKREPEPGAGKFPPQPPQRPGQHFDRLRLLGRAPLGFRLRCGGIRLDG